MERIQKMRSADCLVIYLLTLFAPAYLSISKDWGGVYILGWVWVRVIPDICHFFYTGKIFGE